MHELLGSERELARPVFAEMDYHLATLALIEGTAVGQVYVDDPGAPRRAVAWTRQRVYLAGPPGNARFDEALNALLTDVVAPAVVVGGEGGFVLDYAPAGWEAKIGTVLRGLSPTRAWRHYYRMKELRHDWRTLLPAGMSLEAVDRALLARRNLKNLDHLVYEMQSERQSVEDFLTWSQGCCIVDHGASQAELAGWCLSEYNTGSRCEFGIETVLSYLRRGLAKVTATALAEEECARGVAEIGWHCWASNHPSVATALAVGFEKVREYSTYIVRV